MEIILFLVCQAMARVILDQNAKDGVRSLRLEALKRVTPIMEFYYTEFNNQKLTQTICEKKIAFILQATTKADIDLILGPPKVHYNHSEIVPAHRFVIPEEELLTWSRTSLRGPLTGEGQERFMTLFRQVFPECGDILDVAKSCNDLKEGA